MSATQSSSVRPALAGIAVGLTAGILIATHLVKRGASHATPPAAAASVPRATPRVGRTPAGPQVAVVTGGSRGIGAAISRQLGRAGYKVAVVYQHSSDKADAVVQEIVAAGGAAAAFQCDVGKEHEIVALFAAVKETLGKYLAPHPPPAHTIVRSVATLPLLVWLAQLLLLLQRLSGDEICPTMILLHVGCLRAGPVTALVNNAGVIGKRAGTLDDQV